ncbi:MAG: hypothetical protein LAT55_06630 [Opitutales bacterium]|nr:hypothetical protein [Opitutales bacterium]
MKDRFSFAGLKGRAKRGVTLIELVLALALCATIMGAVSIFIFSMGELWGRGSEVRMFQRHVDGVTRFLDYHIGRAEIFPSDLDGGTAATPVFLATTEERGGFADPLLTFILPESPGLLTWPAEPLPLVVCHLEVRRDEGLVLHWHSVLEEEFRERPPRSLQLSPYVEEIIYWYFDEDAERWEEREDFALDDDNEPYPPDRLQLNFRWEGLTEERILTLPGAGFNALQGRRF